MNTNLDEVLIELKLSNTFCRSNLNEILAELKIKETNYHRTKIISLSEAVIKNPDSRIQQIELNSSLNHLERFPTA